MTKNITLALSIGAILSWCTHNAYAQAMAPVVWTQEAMTAKAMLKWSLKKAKWVDFKMAFPNGKPGFNFVGGKNSHKVKIQIYRPDGASLNNPIDANATPGKYLVRVRLRAPYSNSNAMVTFILNYLME